ncbi:RNA polymerase sigma-70 factor [Aestuariibaculum marinum]|uniref:RNA polymerase sigma-70 factor n=1 Tax=Aestuariibaculum marinum TaxID=2683592 RepID=UPI0021D32820|nr:RNA polymerase sigma-70 factor [Aestuariibaculum marinum]
MTPDELLFKCVKNDNQKALEQLFQKYYFNLCLFAKKYVNDSDLAEEVVSDVFFNVWQNRKTLSINSSLQSYLFVATKNQSLNLVKKAQASFVNEEMSDLHLKLSHYNSDDSLEYTELRNRIDLIIDELPPQRRIIFKLNRIDGLKYKEIADQLGISVSTVQKQMLEAIKYVSQYESQFISSILLFCFLDIYVTIC